MAYKLPTADMIGPDQAELYALQQVMGPGNSGRMLEDIRNARIMEQDFLMKQLHQANAASGANDQALALKDLAGKVLPLMLNDKNAQTFGAEALSSGANSVLGQLGVAPMKFNQDFIQGIDKGNLALLQATGADKLGSAVNSAASGGMSITPMPSMMQGLNINTAKATPTGVQEKSVEAGNPTITKTENGYTYKVPMPQDMAGEIISSVRPHVGNKVAVQADAHSPKQAQNLSQIQQAQATGRWKITGGPSTDPEGAVIYTVNEGGKSYKIKVNPDGTMTRTLLSR